MKSGFKRLKGAAVASAMGLGALGAGSGRAASVTLGVTVTRALVATVSGGAASMQWVSIGSNSTFDINEMRVLTAGGVTTGGSPSSNRFYNDAFDGALGVTVGGITFSNPDTTVDLTGDVLTTDTVIDIVAGVDAKIEYTFIGDRGNTSLGLVRALYSVTNTTAAPITTTVNVFGNLGSDTTTTIQASSSGDRIADDTDLWTVSSQEGGGGDPAIGNDPVLVITRFGTGAAVTPTQTATGFGSGSSSGDDFANDYNLTIPANSTQSVMVFVEAHPTNAGAAADAVDFETLTAANASGALKGLSEAACQTIVNYDTTSGCTSTVFGGGAFNPLTLLSVAGLAGLFRLGRKKRD